MRALLYTIQETLDELQAADEDPEAMIAPLNRLKVLYERFLEERSLN